MSTQTRALLPMLKRGRELLDEADNVAKKAKNIPEVSDASSVELKTTRITVTGLGYYAHRFPTPPARGSEATLKAHVHEDEPAIAVMVNGNKHASVKKEFVDTTMRVINGDRFVRAHFPGECTHIRHRSLELVELA